MRITAIEVRDYKRIQHVKVTPDADRVLMLIGGKNAQGKSSLLDALTAAFGGKRAVAGDPVRHGAKDAEIRVELDDGALVIRRTITATGDTALELRDPDGPLRAPQAKLDALIGARTLDPLRFLALAPAEQRATLLKLIDADGQIAGLDRKRDGATARRTEVGRDLKKAEGELARLPVVTPGTAIQVGELAAEGRALEEVLRAADQAQARKVKAADAVRHATETIEAIEIQIEQLQAKLADSQRKRDGWQAEGVKATAEATEAGAAALAAAARRTAIAERIEQAQEHNRRVAQEEAAVQRRADVESDVLALRTEHAKAEGAIAEVDKRKAEILAAAQLPVPGLGVSDGDVTLDGVPLSQASKAEQYRVAVALQIAAAPELRDIWVHDASLLDEDSLGMLAKVAQDAGARLWLERVGDRDPGAIVIHDGTVRAPAAEVAA